MMANISHAVITIAKSLFSKKTISTEIQQKKSVGNSLVKLSLMNLEFHLLLLDKDWMSLDILNIVFSQSAKTEDFLSTMSTTQSVMINSLCLVTFRLSKRPFPLPVSGTPKKTLKKGCC